MNDNRTTETTGDEHLATRTSKPLTSGGVSGKGKTNSGQGKPARSRNSTSFNTERARKAAEASGRVRREKKIKREETATQNALTFRQRLGVSLSKLTQDELDKVIAGLAHRGNANALARLSDQAFGKPVPAEEENPEDESLASLTREQRARPVTTS